MKLNFPKIESNEDFSRYFNEDFWLEMAREVCRRHNISYEELKRGNSSDHVVFLIDDSLVLKIYRPFRNCIERETKALDFIFDKIDFKTPEIIATDEIANFRYILTTQQKGILMTRENWLALSEKTQTKFISKLAVGLKQIHSLDADEVVSDWAAFVKDRAKTFIERQIAHGVNQKVVEALPKFIEENLKLIPLSEPTVFMHADVHFGNLRVEKIKGEWEISGLFDFADSRRGFYEYEFLAVGLLMMQGQREVQREFFKAYGYAEKDLDETMRKRLMMLTMLYETSDLRRYAMRLKPEAVDFTLDELERGIWSFADRV